jgi:glycosyltransferase involved in cell wall biosynthesis
VIPNGVGSNGAPGREPLRGGVPIVRACGRLVPNKGFGVLLDAASILKRRGIAMKLEIVGEGPERAALEAKLVSSGLGDSVKLLGASAEARELIAGADIFVLSSLMEGLPLVVLEALHAGRPVVVTALPGLEGVVVNGESGLVVPRGDAAALASAVEYLIANPVEARRLARAGRAFAKSELSIERTASSYMELYNEILSIRAR